MENHHSSAAPPNAKDGSSGIPEENKDVAVPNLSSAPEVAATVAASNDDDVSKGKNVVAADNEELKPHIVSERSRRNRLRDYFGELKAYIPQIPEKSDKATIVEHAIDYIKYLEKMKAMLEKRKQELALARQVGVVAAASSSSAPPPPPPPPQTSHGMAVAAMPSDVPAGACSYVPPPPPQPAVPVPAPQLLPATMSSDVVPQPQPLQPAPPQARIITATPVGFQTWSWPDLVLSVSNDTAHISVSAPRHRGMWTKVMVLSVLNKYGIDVVTAQVDSDAVRSVFNIYARVTAMGGGNPSALEVYQLAVSEILVWLTTS
ncbi:hypothetical protein BDA96_07G026700 [Sorghum bicolor]|uniref:BHLH domain-containing protein n=1 Tax=Sorghum bicolor TaxID=4558 RepID=A0A921QID8_SORBI|nr:hypothetical protein BDA96_07G026700 [Sorghum bicolor]